MNLIKVDDFINLILPGLLQRRRTLNTSFFTYNTIGSISDDYIDKYEGGKSGLKIRVYEGDRSYQRIDPSIRVILGEIEFEGRKAERAIDQKLLESMDQPSDLSIVYIGRTAVQYGLARCCRLKDLNPACVVITVMCDCNFQEKEKLIKPLANNGIVDYILLDIECGGYVSMSAILNRIARLWEDRNLENKNNPAV